MDIARMEPSRPTLTVSIAKSQEIYEALQLRYCVFAEEGGARIGAADKQIEQDHFDSYCDHLIVRETTTGMVVGTYRILSFSQAQQAGGFYSETEFDLSRLRPLSEGLVEVGRSCIHPAYRNGGVVSMLWAGLAQYVLTRGYQYLMGAASISLSDGGIQAAETYWHLTGTCLSPDTWRVFPHEPYVPKLAKRYGFVKMPPLIKGYVRLGAYMCGEPAWDRAFGTADILMLLPIARMDPRYARHYFGTAKFSQAEVA